MTTNSEARFKNHFRHIYRAYALSPDENLANLRKRLIETSYQPVHAIKVYFPKKSGVLRPYSLLTVEDQIVYQAMANLIADKLQPRVKNRYLKSVFGNLYAGKNSKFLYRDWREGYKAFSSAIEKAYIDGYTFTASFDLTACFDSIDHSVLKYCLSDIGLECEFCDRLCELLRHWSAASGGVPIYHGHGIPQGPISSGIISEVVLRHFDGNRFNQNRVRYFRYVDDIKLFAKSELELRRRLIDLDLLSKEIGLFPQTGKIDIHEVTSIEDEIKSISNPPEPVLQDPDPDQPGLRRRIVELTPKYTVSNITRFKYVLAAASPNAALARRLIEVIRREPSLYEPVFRYLGRFRKISRVVSRDCLALLREYDLYSAFTASLVNVLRGRVHPSYTNSLNSYCRSRLTTATRDRNPDLRAAAASVLLVSGNITWARTKHNLFWKHHWWVRTELIRFVRKDKYGDPSYHHLLDQLVRDGVADVAIVASEIMATEKVAPSTPRRSVHVLAQNSLKAAGLIGRIQPGVCPVTDFVRIVLGDSAARVGWKNLLGSAYSDMITKMSRWRAYSHTDPTAWVNLSDTINDIVLDAVFRLDSSNIGNYTLGNIGGVLQPSSRFARRYPKLHHAVDRIHSARLESELSHPVVRATGQPTRRIKHKEMDSFKINLRHGYAEIHTVLGV